MYQLVGDAAAFGTVIDHFGILRDVIEDNRGGIVKTIGDSVMAVFRDPMDGIRASLQMIARINEYNAGFEGQPLTLKIGLHQGPCIAVNLNERLDYFGSTVNIAARLEGQSRGGEVVTSQEIMNEQKVQRYLNHKDLYVERYQTVLKGFEGSHHLYRLRLDNNLEAVSEDDAWVDVGN